MSAAADVRPRPVVTALCWTLGPLLAGVESWLAFWGVVFGGFALTPTCTTASASYAALCEAIVVVFAVACALPWWLLGRLIRVRGAAWVCVGIALVGPAYGFVAGLQPGFWDGYCF